MVRERWWADGYELTDGTVRDVETRDGLYSTPEPVRGELSAVGGRSGLLWRPRPAGPGAFSLQGWLGADTRADLEAAYDTLLRRVVRSERLVTWQRQLAGGSIRQALGQVVERIEPAKIGQLAMRIGLVVEVPSGRWTDTGDADTGDLAVTSGVPVDLAAFANATAPMDELVVTITGPVTGNLRVEDARSGLGWSYAAAIAGGGTLTVNAGAWTTSGSLAQLAYDGATFLELQPGDGAGPPQLLVTGDGMTAATRVRVTGRPAYLA